MSQLIWILVGLVVLVFVLTKLGKFRKKKTEEEEEGGVIPDADCCGAHEVCEQDSLLSSSAEIVYYDDEHLDGYAKRPLESYSDSEIEEFREVLYTLNDKEVASWLKSLLVRAIELPAPLRDEALLIVEERRSQITN